MRRRGRRKRWVRRRGRRKRCKGNERGIGRRNEVSNKRQNDSLTLNIVRIIGKFCAKLLYCNTSEILLYLRVGEL